MLGRILKGQTAIKKEIKMTEQEQLDAIAASEVTEVAAIGAAVQTVKDAVAAEEAAEAAGTPINFANIQGAADSLNSVAGNVLSIAAAPPVDVPPAPPTA